MKKIDEMHRIAGTDSHKCGECSNFKEYFYHDRTYFKCAIYGISNSEATDWRKSYQACGWFNQERKECDIVHARLIEKSPEAQIEGQMTLF